MKVTVYKGTLSALVVLALLVSGVPIMAGDPGSTVEAQVGASAEPLPDRLLNDVRRLQEEADEDGNVVVVVKLEGTSLLGIRQERGVEQLKQHATQTQKNLLHFLDRKGADVLNTFWLTNAVLARVPIGLLDDLARQPGVERLFENFMLTIPEPPDRDRLEGLSEEYTWGLDMIRVPEVWSILGSTGSGVRVAVSDTGVDMSHPDLAGKMWTDDLGDPTYPGGWIEFDGAGNIVPGSTPYDTASHGTHCSGTVLGGADSGIAIGVAPDAILMHALILPGGGGTFAQVVAGMEWSVEPFDQSGDPAGAPAHVHSMSWGAGGYHDAMIEPIANMRAAGVVPVPAIGNSLEGSSGSPGNVYQAFGIGATDIDDYVEWWSSGEEIHWPASHPEPYVKPDFSAPGVDVWSSVPGGYGYMSGTSMAAPHAAGTAALMLAANPTLTVDEIYEILKDTAVWYDRYYPEAPCTRYGWGRIDAFEAVAVAALDSGIEGVVTDADTDDPLEGAKVVVAETGHTRHTDASGHYRFYLLPGSYTLTASAFGYYEDTAEDVEVREDVFTSQGFGLTPKPSGFIAGTVTDVETGLPIEGATITVLDTPLSATTDQYGGYSLEAPVDTYDVRTWAWGYKRSMSYDVVVEENETVTVSFALEPTLVVAVLGDYQAQLIGLLMDNDISSHERDWDIIEDMGEYDVVVVNRRYDPGEDTFLEFLDAASDNEVGVVFTNSWPVEWEPYGISLLQWYLGDPAEQGDTYGQGHVYYRVTEAHPIFDGWEVGDDITIITGGWQDYAWFWDSSGHIIGSIGSEYGGIRGDSVTVRGYGKSLHVLLAGLAPQWDTNVSHWTKDAKTIFVNAVTFAALDSGIEGYVTDEETEAPLEGAKVWVNEMGQAAYTDETGFYRLHLSAGSYTVTAEAFGYYESTTEGVEVVEDVFTPQDFALELLPSGFIEGTVTDGDTGDPIKGAIVTLLDTPASTTTDEHGNYSIRAPEGTYDVRAWSWGYWPYTQYEVSVIVDDTMTVGFALEPGLVVAVLGDYRSQLIALLMENGISAEERGWDIVYDLGEYDAVVVNRPYYPGEETFLGFVDAAGDNEVGVVFTSSAWPQWESYGISLLQRYLGDPAGQDYTWAWSDVYYHVTECNPIFEGWDVGDTITIMESADHAYAWFWDYSGYTIGEVGHWYTVPWGDASEEPIPAPAGDAVALNAYGDSLHVLMAGLAPQPYTNLMHWTEDARTIFIRGVLVASGDIDLDLMVATSGLPTGVLGEDYHTSVSAIGGTRPYDWNIVDGALPPGLDFYAETGVISGTPTEVGTFAFTVQVTDDAQDTAIRELFITVIEWTEFITDPEGDQFDGYGPDIVGLDYHRTEDTIYFRVRTDTPVDPYDTANVMWLDLDLNPSTGYTSDAPYVPTNDIGADAVAHIGWPWWMHDTIEENWSLPVQAISQDRQSRMEPEQVLPASLSGGLYLWHPWYEYFYHVGDFPVFTDTHSFWFAIPLEMLDDDGTMSVVNVIGYPWEPTDVAPNEGHGITAMPLEVTITPPLPPGLTAVPYEVELEAVGGVLPYRWTMTAGGLPPGLALDVFAGIISGTPTTAGTFDFTVQVIDDVEHAATADLAITIGESPGIINKAMTDFSHGLAVDDAAGGRVGILEVQDPDTGEAVEVPVGAYNAEFHYDGSIVTVMEVHLTPPFDTGAFNINNPGGVTGFAGLSVDGAIAPVDLAFLTLRLVGSVHDQSQGTLVFTEIIDVDAEPLAPAPAEISHIYRRGDARADGEVNIADALWIAQYLAGMRGLGYGLDKVHPVNAASVNWDVPIDEINIADVLYICQYLVGLRDAYFNLIEAQSIKEVGK